MNNRIFRLFGIILFLGLTLSACGQMPAPNKGIELGNPEGEVNPIRVQPLNGDVAYELKFLDQSRTLVSRKAGGSEARELVVYRRDARAIKLEAEFSGNETIALELLLDENGMLLSGSLQINGLQVPAKFETLHPSGDSGGDPDSAYDHEEPPSSLGEVDPDSGARPIVIELGETVPDRMDDSLRH